jgi:hypothetical protein
MALPEPECGLVISYAYLWRHECEAGQSEGLKDRPCAIVLAMAGTGDDPVTVTVAPIMHAAPRHPDLAIEIPPRVKRHLGLDERRSWIVLDEFNEFAWPGFDLRQVPGKPGHYEYGFLPPALFMRISGRIGELRREGKGISLSREAD